MRLIFLFYQFILIAIIFSCGESKSPKSEQAEQSKPTSETTFQKRVILLIDASASLTEGSQKLAVQYAGEVADVLGDESHLLVYTTEKNPAQPAIVDEKKSAPLNPMARTDFNTRIWPATIKRIKDTVEAKCRKGESTSCILDGLKSVKAGLANASKAEETYLLIISDMLEDCELGHPETAKDFAKMKIVLEKSDLGEFQLASKIPLLHVKICYINHDARPGNVAMIGSSEFRAFWQQAFKMLGYTEMPEPGTSIAAFLDMIKE